MAQIIDIRTRAERVPVPIIDRSKDEQRVADFALTCEDHLRANAVKLRAVSGLDRVLRTLHRLADEMRNAGNPNYQSEKMNE